MYTWTYPNAGKNCYCLLSCALVYFCNAVCGTDRIHGLVTFMWMVRCYTFSIAVWRTVWLWLNYWNIYSTASWVTVVFSFSWLVFVSFTSICIIYFESVTYSNSKWYSLYTITSTNRTFLWFNITRWDIKIILLYSLIFSTYFQILVN